MPDWSYRTVFRPLLFRLPFPLARDVCFGFMGGLARLPLGGTVIDFLGHMRPDARLETTVAGLSLSSPVVVGPFLDPRLAAIAALSRFGVGMIEIGPVSANAAGKGGEIRRQDDVQSLEVAEPLGSVNVEVAARCLTKPPAVPVLVRCGGVGSNSGDEHTADCESVIAALGDRTAAIGIVLDDEVAGRLTPRDWSEHVRRLVRAAAGNTGSAMSSGRPLLLCVPADINLDAASAYLEAGLEGGADGIVVDGKVRAPAGAWLVGPLAFKASLETVQRLRKRFGDGPSIVAGGADDPRTALELLSAGANAVQIDATMAYAGPGLPKRINEAIWFARCRGDARTGVSDGRGSAHHRRPVAATEHAAAMSWFWALLLGVAMTLGGLMALWFASTRVLLPYDEAYLGMTADELTAKVPRLLEFMAHDRVTLAGTMLAVGIQYLFLAWCGIRRGEHWAKITVVASAFAGFLSFFLFLGFGYFDPLHAFVTAILFQFLLLAFQGPLADAQPPAFPNLVSDWRWQLANWGQLLLVIQGVAVFVAGVTIATVGITTVFVPEDLEFMGTTAEAIRAVNPWLVPVVAHDRASFGGMLISVGLATLLPALWGIRQGARWVWWMLAIAGTLGYGPTLVVHLHVGYTDPTHLAPAFGGLGMLWLALALLYPQLAARNLKHEAAWRKLISELP